MRDLAVLKGENYIAGVRTRYAWGYFGLLSILDFLAEERGLEVGRETTLIYRYLREGVADPFAVALLDIPGMDLHRTTVITLAQA